MRYFLEVWLRGNPNFAPHPHITFVRPFEIDETQEEIVKQEIVDYCKGKKPINFILEGKGNFGDINYVPVKSGELEKFDAGLEKLLENEVNFDKKLSDKKILHITLTKDIDSFPRTESAMTRLVCLRDKRIWFSYDFVTGKVLNREETLQWKE